MYKCHPRQQKIWCENGSCGTDNPWIAYIELTYPPRVRLWGPWENMFFVMSHKNKLKSDMLSLFFHPFLARPLLQILGDVQKNRFYVKVSANDDFHWHF